MPRAGRLNLPTVTGKKHYPILPLKAMTVNNLSDSRATAGATAERQVDRAFASGGRSFPSGLIFSVTGGSCNPQQWRRRRGLGWTLATGWRQGKTAVTAAARQQQQRRRCRRRFGLSARTWIDSSSRAVAGQHRVGSNSYVKSASAAMSEV